MFAVNQYVALLFPSARPPPEKERSPLKLCFCRLMYFHFSHLTDLCNCVEDRSAAPAHMAGSPFASVRDMTESALPRRETLVHEDSRIWTRVRAAFRVYATTGGCHGNTTRSVTTHPRMHRILRVGPTLNYPSPKVHKQLLTPCNGESMQNALGSWIGERWPGERIRL